MPRMRMLLAALLFFCLVGATSTATRPDSPVQPILDVMAQELARSMENLGQASPVPLYHLCYSVTELGTSRLAVTNGGQEAPVAYRKRFLDVDLRVGGEKLDNTHEIRGGGRTDNRLRRRLVAFPLDDDPAALRAALWNETEYQYRQGQERFAKVLANRQVKVEEQDLSADFTAAETFQYSKSVRPTLLDVAARSAVLKEVGEYFSRHSFVQLSRVQLLVTDQTTYMVSSDGARLQHGGHFLRVMMEISGMDSDGMWLRRSHAYNTASVANLPQRQKMLADAARLIDELRALIGSPVAEPFSGPAILRNRAAAVFFHEIFGHRLEGHRQKSESEGQTFTKRVNQPVLPEFLSVFDDPTLTTACGVALRGHYLFDDEGTPAQRVTVVKDGILKNFLTTRSPIAGFPTSNGHGRREYGHDIVARQGNLIIQSAKTVPFAQLREMLVAEIRRQDKPYGLIFEDISGGFTTTGRRGPQVFKVNPLLVKRVYADGRPDEVVRGVDIVGTPLAAFDKILMAGDDPAVFNGTCGAESGSVRVAAVAPSILVSEIEIEKRRKGQEKPPILSPPGQEQRADGGKK